MATEIGQVFTHKNVLLLHHSIIFSILGDCAETISKKESKFIIKFKQKYIDKNPIFILDYSQIANFCVLVLKFKKNPHGFCFVYNFKVFKFEIGHRSDFNRNFSICWNRAGRRFQRVEIGSVADFGDGNRKSKWALS